MYNSQRRKTEIMTKRRFPKIFYFIITRNRSQTVWQIVIFMNLYISKLNMMKTFSAHAYRHQAEKVRNTAMTTPQLQLWGRGLFSHREGQRRNHESVLDRECSRFVFSLSSFSLLFLSTSRLRSPSVFFVFPFYTSLQDSLLGWDGHVLYDALG